MIDPFETKKLEGINGVLAQNRFCVSIVMGVPAVKWNLGSQLSPVSCDDDGIVEKGKRKVRGRGRSRPRFYTETGVCLEQLPEVVVETEMIVTLKRRLDNHMMCMEYGSHAGRCD